MKLFVTMPRLTAASVSGSGDVAIDRVEGRAFKGVSAGSGAIDIAALNVQTADLAMQGSSAMALRGSVGVLSVAVAGSGDIDGSGLAVRSANVSIVGSGSLKAAVDGPAAVSILGSGDADLGARARCTTKKIGSGSAHCGA